MKILPLLAAVFLTALPATAQGAFPLGDWSSQDGLVAVRIAPCAPTSAAVCGTIIDDARTDTEANPPGHRVLMNVKLKRGVWRGKFADGSISGSVTLKPKGPSDAAVRFCLAAIACDTETWRRTDLASDVMTVQR